MVCIDVGTTNPDVAGIGIIIAFSLQALISIVLSSWAYALNSVPDSIREDDAERERVAKKDKKMKIIDGILLSASDAQTLNGIALLISGLSQIKTLDLYHLHLVYDIVNFTSISNCAAIYSSFKTLKEHRLGRFLAISVFVLLYLAYTILFGIQLNGWNESIPGRCYDTSKTALRSSRHPYVDQIYLGITCFFLIGVLEWALIAQVPPKVLLDIGFGNPPEMGQFIGSLVLFYAVFQFPLHLYSVIALRVTNEHLLHGDSENAWGFGQVVAVVMFAQTLIECSRGFKEYRDWKKETAGRLGADVAGRDVD